MKKENKKMIKLLGIFSSVLLGGAVIRVLIPYMYSLFLYILDLGINVFYGVILSLLVTSIIGVSSILFQYIKIQSVYETDEQEMIDNSDYMRKQLSVIKGNEKEKNDVKEFEDFKYNYLFDNEYRDDMNYDNVIIDDISEFYVRDNSECLGNVGYSRCKKKYKGRYLR